MGKLIIVILIALLAGCERSVHPNDIENAENLCRNNGGVKVVWVSVEHISIQCKDTAIFKNIKRESK